MAVPTWDSARFCLLDDDPMDEVESFWLLRSNDLPKLFVFIEDMNLFPVDMRHAFWIFRVASFDCCCCFHLEHTLQVMKPTNFLKIPPSSSSRTAFIAICDITTLEDFLRYRPGVASVASAAANSSRIVPPLVSSDSDPRHRRNQVDGNMQSESHAQFKNLLYVLTIVVARMKRAIRAVRPTATSKPMSLSMGSESFRDSLSVYGNIT